MFSVVQHLLTADVSAESVPESLQRDMQEILMDCFFRNITPEKSEELATSEGHNCDTEASYWPGMTLKNGIIRAVYFSYRQMGNFLIQYLPPTVKSLQISQCYQSYSVTTRRLPRSLRVFQMHENGLFGTLDLDTLPEFLREFIAYHNNISGPIELTHLPQSLTKLNLLTNKIEQKVVVYGNLPPNIKLIAIGSQGRMRIKAIRPMHSKDQLSDECLSAIFGKQMKFLPPCDLRK